MPVDRITIFGSAVPQNKAFTDMAYTTGRLLVEKGYGVITGGGPGFMIAANHGAYDAARLLEQEDRSLGILVRGVDEDFENAYGRMMKVDSFLVRKELLINLSNIFILFPGGIGTMDEFFELLNRCKHGMKKGCCTILVNSAYWAPLLEWFQKAEQKQYITKQHCGYFKVVDTLDELMSALDCRQGSNCSSF